MESLTELLDELKTLSKPGKGFKPHKYLLLLSLLRMFREGTISNRRVYFTDLLKGQFRLLLDQYGDSSDRERPYTPFFHLGSSTFWKLVPTPGHERELAETSTIGGPGALVELVQYAELSEVFFSAIGHEDSFRTIESEILECLSVGCSSRQEAYLRERKEDEIPVLPRISLDIVSGAFSNPFVAYLNSLQRISAGNENALAESQACNPSFAHIHVPHPLSRTILDELRDPEGRHVVLTGHAGDGKSTIALEVFKELTGLHDAEPLAQPLASREDIPDAPITIMKDLSERRKEEDASLIQELLTRERRFLLVSNTGTLLDLLRVHAADFGVSEVRLESEVLGAISAEEGRCDLALNGARFLVINLARIDNLDLARKIFDRMVAPERWAVCDSLPCSKDCPIRLNVNLINYCREVVFDRLFLAYRRMYEYGTRLTLRQITEHLAYLVTSGLEESDIGEMRKRQRAPLKAEFMFFNRFFGDNGYEDHGPALQMRAVSEIRKQGFGERPCPVWERKLWLKLRQGNFRLGVAYCDAEFDLLREHGSGPGSDARPGLTPDQAREQVRRMLYFLHDFPEDDPSYVVEFLNSPSILRWQQWQKPGARLEMTEKNTLEHRIYHVLQEHFTGVRLPEGAAGHDRRLYITLSRGRNDVRQSAQVVLAQVDWSNETALELVPHQDPAGGNRTDLELQGRGRIQGANLVLKLPFLDYVIMRHFGEVGEILQAAYVERLERFKARVQMLANDQRSDIMLVRLRTDHTFRRQQYTVCDGKLEVTDVL